MVQYYWNPNLQQPNFQNPNFQQPNNQQPNFQQPNNQQPNNQQPPISNGRPILPRGETSYIENILRLNIGNPGVFHFSFEQALEAGVNSISVNGVVEAAGRDHVIIKDNKGGHNYLFPMIYFDYADFTEGVEYFPQ